jgi:hypothetical protein
MEATNSDPAENSQFDMNDPLLSTGLEHGAEIKRIDNS